MRILVTGAYGFIAKNLIAELNNRRYRDLLFYDKDDNLDLLNGYCQEAEFVFHLAGVNRPGEDVEYMRGNVNLTGTLLNLLNNNGNICPVMMASSTRATLDNPYGRSKKAGEDLVLAYGQETGVPVFIYRFPNVFGKWCRPNYNSAVATFCHNISRDLPITVNDPRIVMQLVYIDDVVQELLRALHGKANCKGNFCEVPVVYSITLGEIVELIYGFRNSREALSVPDMKDEFTRKLYGTYLSYLPPEKFKYPLKMKIDERGSFAEFIKTPDRGQISVNISKPGTIKGNHWHHSKNEKFLVVSGTGVIRFRALGSEDVISYLVSGDRLEVVDIPPGYTHNIENIGEGDMVTLMWANEPLDPDRSDTFYLQV